MSFTRKRLLDYARAAGCAGKACQADLFAVLKGLPAFVHPDLLVGSTGCDDAGVYRIDNDKALVLTVDVMAPVADDPYVFGQIAAANSLSDVYAMGGVPIAALGVLGFPVLEVPAETIRQMLAGAWNKVKEAEAVVVGGHTMKDEEIKFGLAVVGLVHPERVITNAGVKPGDILVLTKPLGVGLITTALKMNKVDRQLVTVAYELMTKLNRVAAMVMVEIGVAAATDVTGFGLLGHTWEMAEASGVDIVIESKRVPIIAGVEELVAAGLVPLGTKNNYEFIQDRADFVGVDEIQRLVLCDAQTSGGLLIALPEKKVDMLLTRLTGAGIDGARVIGYATKGSGRLRVE